MSLDSPAGRARDALIADDDDRQGLVSAWLDRFLAVRVPCETCGGTGRLNIGTSVQRHDPCPNCRGSGSVSALRVLLDEEGT